MLSYSGSLSLSVSYVMISVSTSALFLALLCFPPLSVCIFCCLSSLLFCGVYSSCYIPGTDPCRWLNVYRLLSGFPLVKREFKPLLPRLWLLFFLSFHPAWHLLSLHYLPSTSFIAHSLPAYASLQVCYSSFCAHGKPAATAVHIFRYLLMLSYDDMLSPALTSYLRSFLFFLLLCLFSCPFSFVSLLSISCSACLTG